MYDDNEKVKLGFGIIFIFLIILFVVPGLIFSSQKKVKEIKVKEEVNIEYQTAEDLPSAEKIYTEEDLMYLEYKDLEKYTDKKEYFLHYKEFISKHSDNYPPPLTVYDIYSEDGIYLMQRVIETEAFGQDFDSKVNVASVILNRIEGDNSFGNTVMEVVKPGQFCYGRKQISEDTILALEYAFEIEDTTNGCLYFHSNPKTETFSGAVYVFTDSAGHHFYR